MNDRLAAEEKMIRESWFKDHKANYSIYLRPIDKNPISDGIEVLHWAKPGTGVYQVIYWYQYSVLCVFGDVGEAVYRWHSDIGYLKDLAGLSLDYFASKCQGSETGRQYLTWDRQTAEINVAYHVNQLDKKHIALWKEYEGRRACGFKGEWHQWLGEYGYDVFGDICEMGEIGDVISSRCHSHLIGLKMAFEQLLKKEGQ